MLEIFNFLAIAMSIIVGLGLTTTLDSLSKTIKYRKRIKVYWVHLLWVFSLLFLIFQYWFGIWDFQQVQAWTYPAFVALLLPPIALYMVGDLAFPEFEADKEYNLRDYYYKQRRWFFAFTASYLFVDGINSTLMLTGTQWNSLDNTFRVFGIALVLAAAWRKDHRSQGVLAVIAFLALGAFVLIFSTAPLVVQALGN